MYEYFALLIFIYLVYITFAMKNTNAKKSFYIPKVSYLQFQYLSTLLPQNIPIQ